MSRKKSDKLVKRYNRSDMLMHWTVVVGFVLAMITGYIIFFKGSGTLLSTDAGWVLALIHRIGGVLLAGAPLLYFIFSKNRFGFLDAFKFTKNDFGWVKAAPKYYFVGGGDMPPQPKYNTGQKLFYITAVVCGLLLTISGLHLWFGWFPEARTLGLAMIVIHSISAAIFTAFFFVHIYLVGFHPKERTSFNAMTTGYMDRKYAAENHELWYAEIKAEEEKQALKERKAS